MTDDLNNEVGIEYQVIRILAEHFPAARWKVELGSRLVEDLCVDSISLIEIVMALNDSFGIELPEAGVERWRTVKDICFLVRKENDLNALDKA